MAKSVGKIFEECIKNSVPSNCLVYRPPDAAQGFNIQANSKLRFSNHSPCDFFIYTGSRLWTIECKTFQGSCSFEKDKTEKGIIHYYQVESLLNFAKYKNVISGFLLDFRKSDNTYFLEINEYIKLIGSIDKKSFTEKDMCEYSHPILLNKQLKKKYYKYDMEQLLFQNLRGEQMYDKEQ